MLSDLVKNQAHSVLLRCTPIWPYNYKDPIKYESTVYKKYSRTYIAESSYRI